MSEKENDLLDSLLDSLSENQEMEKKMENFARNKERSLRIQRARQTSEQFQQTYSSQPKEKKAEAPQKEETPIEHTLDLPPFGQPTKPFVTIQAQSLEEDLPEDTESTRRIDQANDAAIAPANSAGGSTRVFSGPAQTPKEEPAATMKVSGDEIQSLLEQDTPLLRREYFASDEEEEDETDIPAYRQVHKSSHRSHRLGAVLGVVLTLGVIGVGGWMMWDTFLSKKPSSSLVSQNFDKVMAWAKDYATLSADDQKKITQFRSLYDKLSEDEKRKINETLLKATGKTFDELLAAATTAQKPQSSNTNMANAERKAKLKDQIDALQNEINNLNNQLASVNQRVVDAQNDYNAKQQAANDAKNAADAADQIVNNLQGELDQLPSESSLNAQISSLQSELSSLGKETTDKDHSADSSQSTQPVDNSARKQELQTQIADLKNQLAALPGKRNDLNNQINTAKANASKDEQAANAAQQEADRAYGAWQAVAGDPNPIINQINDKQAQQNTLRNQYNSID